MIHVNMTPPFEQGLKPIKCLDVVHVTTLNINCHEGQEYKLGMVKWFNLWILYIKATVMSVCLFVWAVPGKFFQS
jgi:hypothetical protein